MAVAKKTVLGRFRNALGWMFAVLLLVLIGLLVTAGRFVTPQFLVQEVEEAINSRMEVSEVEVQVFRRPARIVVRGIRLGQRDEFVGQALESRGRMEQAPIEVEEVRLDVELVSLLFREIDLRKLVLVEPSVELVLGEDGENVVEQMLRPSPEREKKRRKKGKRPGGALNLDELGGVRCLQGVQVLRAVAKVHLEETGMRIDVDNFSMVLDALEVDPNDLVKTNDVRVRLDGAVALSWGGSGSSPSACFDIDGTAKATLFDPVTADFDPDLTGALVLREQSYLSTRIPPISGSWAKIGKVANWGVRLVGLPDRARFGRAATVGVRYFRERVTTIDPLSLWLGDWELAVLEGSWVDLSTEEHVINGEFVASEGVSGALYSAILNELGLSSDVAGKEIASEIEKAWLRDGRLVSRVRSTGTLSDPEVDVLNESPELKEILKDAVERRAKEALEDLGGALLERLLDDKGNGD